MSANMLNARSGDVPGDVDEGQPSNLTRLSCGADKLHSSFSAGAPFDGHQVCC